jgi:putative serine protease PepD
MLLATTLLVACAGCTASQDTEAAPSTAASSSVKATPDARGTKTSESDVDWAQVADAAEPTVVSISVTGQQGAGQGSGVVIDDGGHVLTNNHVVAAAAAGADIQVSLSDARVFDAELVGADRATDLAVVRIQGAPVDLTALEFGNSEAVEVGQPVMALGNPLGLSNTVTLGIVSALDRPVTTQSAGVTPSDPATPVVTNAIQTDAAVNPGNSGGALVDAAGHLVGINSSIATLGASEGGQGGSIGLGFAIPSNQALWVAEELIATGAVEHAYLGVSPESAVVSVEGVRRQAAGISAVFTDTPAAEGGLRPGEAVTAVDGETVGSAESLVAQIRERQPGTEVTLTVVDSGGDARDVTVRFGTNPEQ